MQHAFLITAYQNIKNLNRLLELLDDDRCDIFLHIDAKAKIDAGAVYAPQRARLHSLPALNIRWGHVSLIECTLKMLTYALNYEWDYCHYITESDMPLKTIDEIDLVFVQNNGREFIDFSPENYDFSHYKCDVYHFFPYFSRYHSSKFLKVLNHGFAKLQWILGYRRRDMKYLHGSAYFSITRDFAGYIAARSEAVCKMYAHTLAADEVWLQTLCRNSSFFDRVYRFESKYTGNLRFIDWSRREGNSPYTFCDEDYESLIKMGRETECCFARKFSAESSVAERLRKDLLRKDGRK